MHVIIGKGNLAVDLKLSLAKYGERAIILTRSSGFEWPSCAPNIRSLNPTYIWVTAGHGSVREANEDHDGCFKTHTVMPTEMLYEFDDNVCLGFFSSDYVADPRSPSDPRSQIQKPVTKYAWSKLMLEQAVESARRPNTAVFRICSLYGSHYPEKTFPGKIHANFPMPTELELPENIVCPTPTWWLAHRLVSNLNLCFDERFQMRHHVAPSGGISTRDWGHLVLGEGYRIKSRGLDPDRPAVSSLKCSLGMEPVDDWSRLWGKHLSFATTENRLDLL